jgi:hypothetical protein
LLTGAPSRDSVAPGDDQAEPRFREREIGAAVSSHRQEVTTMQRFACRAFVIESAPRCSGVALISRRHIDLQRVAGALCPR